jgi:predicted AlkP superfamily phosphohydrolase/phosphomutase
MKVKKVGSFVNKPRTFIIGLDGSTFNIIHPLVRAGCLPHLSKLMAQGAYGSLEAWPNMSSASSWSSIVTGYNPGQHGIYNFNDAPIQKGPKWHSMNASERKKDPFWRFLSAAGQSVGVINVPISYPADRIHGFMLAGMDSPSMHSHGFAHPPDLLDELRRQGIDYVIDVPTPSVIRHLETHQCPVHVQRMVDAQARTILHLMKTRPWDVLMAVFTAPEKVQHFFYPDQHGSVDTSDWIPIRQLYEQIDSFLGEALGLINENTTILIISDHGFGPAYFPPSCLNPLFSQLGFLSYRHDPINLKGRFLKKLLFYGRRLVPLRLQKPLAMAFPKLYQRALRERLYSNVEWSKSRVFAPPYGRNIYINLQGRQPKGIVSPEDYDSLCEQVRQILLNLTDPATGKPLVREVYRHEDLYHGPYTDGDGDLFIKWDYNLRHDSVCYMSEGRPIIFHNPKPKGVRKWLTGSHRPDGIFIAYGEGIKRKLDAPGAHIYDIFPTIFYLQNLPIPSDMDGRVLTNIFTEERLQQHPVRQLEPKK